MPTCPSDGGRESQIPRFKRVFDYYGSLLYMY